MTMLNFIKFLLLVSRDRRLLLGKPEHGCRNSTTYIKTILDFLIYCELDVQHPIWPILAATEAESGI